MKTDTIFYKLFQEFPDIFFELIGKPETNSNLYEFQSQEVKETSFRLDGIFLTLENLSHEPIYFVEVQCYKDELFYDRFLTSILLYFYQYQPLNSQWYAIVIFDTRANDVDFPQRLNSLREPHLRCFYLDELRNASNQSLGLEIVKLIVEGKRKTKKLVEQLINRTREEVNDAAIQRKVLELIEAILVNKFPNLSREEVKEMLALELIRGTRVYQELKEEAREEVKAEIQEEIREKIKAQVKLEVREEVEQEVKAQVKLEVREEVEQEVKAQVKLEVREQVEQEVKAQVKLEVREEVEQEVKAQVKLEVREEVEQEVKAEIKEEMIKKFLQRGMSVQELAELFELDVEIIARLNT
ncbi:Rpn family recombination-promoting nuclease/putative transposase [Fortiea contorta]|uniref:Rpn family recombination-promoting nuclease/putative transposase n=1 Tax=Fortiea contorta TaxID=1892405 RepID=UPI00034494AC|nr:Rpn family recombination-promoting nuclease/putative transposase [Fortiea contorta]